MNTAVASYEPAQALLTRIGGTDVWYRSYQARNDARFSYELSVNDNLVPFDQVTDWGARSATFHRDPFNKRVHESGFGREVSVAEGPRAPRDEWSDTRAGVATGRVEQMTVKSELLGTTRDVWVYTPAGYDTLARKGGLPLLLTFDGGEYVKSIHVPTILDNLVAAKRIAPMVAVFVGSAEEQRDVELNQNERYARFLASELLPSIRARYAIASSPARNVVAGSSMGGLAAAFVANRHPELFGNVLSQSGAYMFGAPGEQAGERMKHEIEASPKRDVAYYLEAGIYENDRLENGVDLLSSNRHLHDALMAKGYRVTYGEFAGGHSDLNWRSGFSKGLIALRREVGAASRFTLSPVHRFDRSARTRPSSTALRAAAHERRAECLRPCHHTPRVAAPRRARRAPTRRSARRRFPPPRLSAPPRPRDRRPLAEPQGTEKSTDPAERPCEHGGIASAPRAGRSSFALRDALRSRSSSRRRPAPSTPPCRALRSPRPARPSVRRTRSNSSPITSSATSPSIESSNRKRWGAPSTPPPRGARSSPSAAATLAT